jgi:hypothetical protein
MKNKKVHSLTGQITYTLVLEAFDAVYANQGAPGIDGMSLTRFSDNLSLFFTLIHTASDPNGAVTWLWNIS